MAKGMPRGCQGGQSNPRLFASEIDTHHQFSIKTSLSKTSTVTPNRMMMMIAFITFNSSLVPLIEGLCSPDPWKFELSGFRRNRTDDLGINSPLL